MKYLRIGFISVLFLITLQSITFYTIADDQLVGALGENYESFVYGYQENQFDHIVIISKTNPGSDRILEAFPEFRSHALTVCKSQEKCSNIKTGEFYLYHFDYTFKTPFFINVINESEMAHEYGASWSSQYVWVFYKWILVNKKNTGIS